MLSCHHINIMRCIYRDESNYVNTVCVFLFPHQSFGCLHSHHPGAIADHVTDLPKYIINQSDLLIGRRDGHNADWTDRTVNYKSGKATANQLYLKCVYIYILYFNFKDLALLKQFLTFLKFCF